MKNKITTAALCLTLLLTSVWSTNAKPNEFVFRFVYGNDMFYIPWEGNGERLDSLCKTLDANILKDGSIHVDGYGRDIDIVRVRCNRLKTELINRCGLNENHFITTNNIGKFNGMKYVVVVSVPASVVGASELSAAEVAANEAARQAEEAAKVAGIEAQAAEVAANEAAKQAEETAKVAGTEAKAAEVATNEAAKQAEEAAKAAEVAAKQAGEAAKVAETEAKTANKEQIKKSTAETAGRWSVGVNVGVPFFWGDMLTIAADKTYGGVAAGVQGSYKICSLLSTSLSVDYAYGKLGHRGYAKDYLLAPDGMTWYVPHDEPMKKYSELNSKVSLINVGLSLDVNINRFFGEEAAKNRFTAWVSPTVYGQFFFSDIRLRENGELYSNGTTAPAAISLGLGGSASLRYQICPAVSIQLKNTVAWLTDNNFDAIRTPYGQAKQNAMWLLQVGAIWHIDNK